VRRAPLKLIIASAVFLFVPFVGLAQVTTGLPPFGSFSGGPLDMVNNANLNVHFEVPIMSKSGRGMPFSYALTYDSSVWYPVAVAGTESWQPATGFGWGAVTQALTGYVTYSSFGPNTCYNGQQPVTFYTFNDFSYVDSLAAQHLFNIGTIYSPASQACNNGSGIGPTQATGQTTDGSGYTMTGYAGATSASISAVTGRSGTSISPPLLTGTGSGSVTDANGNYITATYASGITTFTDTLNTSALTVTPKSATETDYTYTGGTGSVTVKVNYGLFPIRTNFGCSSVTDYGKNGAISQYLVSSIDLPDGTSYNFTYEATPGHSGDYTGRLASVQVPNGGTISYTYTGGSQGITCADGSAAGLTRTTPDGQWTYTRGTGSPASTTVQDPLGNQTVMDFQGIYETERKAYKGTSSGTLLETVDTCYNTSVSNPCTTVAVGLPISTRRVWTTLTGSANVTREAVTSYDSFGFPTEVDEYGYSSNLLRKTLTTYDVLASGNASFEEPSEVQVYDEQSGSAVLDAQTTYTYSNTVTASSGTPQHTSAPGDRGNLVQITYNTAGSSSLSKSFTYYDTGMLRTATDVNNATTTYNYPDATSTCGNAFATSVTLPITYANPPSTTWDCNGTVPLTSTDVNDQSTSYTYNDPFWRLTKLTDPVGATTNITYGDVSGEFDTESTLTFNDGNSTVDLLTYFDGLGRPIISQRRQAPGSTQCDSVQTKYDSLGRLASVSMPYVEKYEQPAPSGTAFTTYTYDALSRPQTITYGDGGQVTYTYNERDVAKAVSGGTKTCGLMSNAANCWQYEYDGVGRLLSVCEITALTGKGTCNQTVSNQGFFTSYSNNALGQLTGSTQNAQASQSQWQTRGYQYDLLGRMTQETNPESGATSYTYDSDPTCGTSKGDLVKEADAVGNVICFAYDALHRLTAEWVSSGPYSTDPRYFVYDSATLNNVAMPNAEGRLAEACTGGNGPAGHCSGTTLVTNLGFGYDARGELTDTYTWTSQSSGWYHANEAYREEPGLPYQLNLYGNSGALLIPAMTYGADGEGRVNAVVASGQSPVSTVGHACEYTTGAPATVSSVTYGSGDSDYFTCDPSTGRTTQYQFNVGSQSMVGNLTWNQNGTLQKLAITDPFDSADQQTCTDTYDDLARISGVSCTGSGFSQTFTPFDVFGNQQKSGTLSFNASYSSSNRITSVGGQSYTYDADGNLTRTGSGTGTNAYSWNAFGGMVFDTPSGGSTIGVNYDALGRAAMTNVNGASFTEFVYAPDGSKLALMNGQTLSRARVLLPGGGLAIFDPTGLIRYWHSDWQGSYRLISNPNRTYYGSGAAAPYGESYAENPSTLGTPFAGLISDTSSELNDALFREYSPTQGRWIRPDPAGLAAVDLTNPQSLNRYAYVGNNPTTLVDPLGLGPQQQTCGAPGTTVPQDYTPQVYCYNHTGIAGGSSPGAFFTNTADEFDLIGLVLNQANQGFYYWPCPNGDCGYKTQAIFVASYTPDQLAPLLNGIWAPGVLYYGGAGIRGPRIGPAPAAQKVDGTQLQHASFWDKLEMAVGCVFGETAPELLTGAEPQPADSTDAPEGSGEPQPSYGPMGQINPQPSSGQLPSAGMTGLQATNSVMGCLSAVKNWP
jgi:RHS repeat-associated protein